MDPSGTHILADFYGVEDPGEEAISTLRSAAVLAGCDILDEREHIFPGGGRTAFLVLSQSHAAIHTWPECGYVGFDLFSCRKLAKASSDLIVAFVREKLRPSRECVQVIERGNDAV